MAQGKNIIVSGEPKGKTINAIISGTPKPGTCMTVLAATEPVGGLFTYEVYNRAADGNRAPVGVLLEDVNQGYDETQAFVTGTIGQIYFPTMGEILNMLVANIAGTGDSFAIGDYMIIDDGTGKLIATAGSPESEPFVIMETSAAITADTLLECMYTGH